MSLVGHCLAPRAIPSALICLSEQGARGASHWYGGSPRPRRGNSRYAAIRAGGRHASFGESDESARHVERICLTVH